MLPNALRRHGAEIALAALVVLVVGMMIVPLPTWLLDLLIAANLCLSLLLLSTALLLRRPMAFGAFPTILLVTTLFRLALNVSSTRLILSQADAGEVIAAFGDFVVRGDYIVGAVVFLILTLIQFVVIARGSERVAEVGARFTLDAMPGKQLAIDADLRAGVLDAEGAAARRRELERESQFYGAMDGAMKFVKGDAVAAIAITAINITGGLAIGVLTRDLGATEALETYGLLAIGDGLVSQIPALLISTAAGLVVTRVASEDEEGTLGGDIGAQVFGDWRALAIAAAFSGMIALVPGLPLVPFAVLGASLGGLAFWLRRERRRDAVVYSGRDAMTAPSGPLELRVGDELAARLRADEELVPGLRDRAAALYETRGVRLPALSPQRFASLDPNAYEIRVADVPVDRGRCPPGRRWREGEPEELRRVDPGVELDGDGGWLEAALAPEGRSAAGVLLLRLGATVLRHADGLVGLEETKRELDGLAREAPALVREVVPARLSLPRLTTLLRALVAEGVSIRSLRQVLEAASVDPLPKEDAPLLETIRGRLGAAISHALTGPDGVLRALAVDPMVEEALRDARGGVIAPDLAEDVIGAVRAAIEGASSAPAAVLTQPDVRSSLRALLRSELPDVPILSYHELDAALQVERVGVVTP